MDWAAGGQQVLDLVLVPRLRSPKIPKLLHRPRMPRPGDPDIIKRFTLATGQGHTMRTAATLAGISRETARGWVERGIEQLEAQEQVPADSAEASAEPGSHAAFAAGYLEAQAAFVSENLGILNEAKGPKGKSWVPALALLKALFPKEYGDRQYSFIETKTDINVTFSVEALPPARQLALAQLAVLRLKEPEDVVDGELVEP